MVGSRDLAADDQMKLHFVTTSFFFGPHTQYGWNNFGTLSFHVYQNQQKKRVVSWENALATQCFSNPMF